MRQRLPMYITMAYWAMNKDITIPAMICKVRGQHGKDNNAVSTKAMNALWLMESWLIGDEDDN